MKPFNTLQVCYRHIEDMCKKNFNAEKIIFDKFTAFLTLPIIDHYVYRIMVDSAYFVKSTPPRVFSVSY